MKGVCVGLGQVTHWIGDMAGMNWHIAVPHPHHTHAHACALVKQTRALPLPLPGQRSMRQ